MGQAPKGMRTTLLLLLVLALPGSLRAQAGPPSSIRDGRVRSAVAFTVQGSRIAGSSRVHLGGWAGLVLGGHFLVGGGGFAPTQNVELPGTDSGTGFLLRMGYGGLVFRYWKPLDLGVTASGGMLLGAGHARVRDRLQGTELGSDNFFVLEPTLSLAHPLLSWLHIEGTLGYRKALDVEDLPTVSAADLSSFTGALSLRVGGM